MRRGVEAYVEEVRSGVFPAPEHVYSVEPSELDSLRQRLNREDLESNYSWDWEPLA